MWLFRKLRFPSSSSAGPSPASTVTAAALAAMPAAPQDSSAERDSSVLQSKVRRRSSLTSDPGVLDRDQLDLWLQSSYSSPPSTPTSTSPPANDLASSTNTTNDRQMEELCASVTTELVGPEFALVPVPGNDSPRGGPESKLAANSLHKPVRYRVMAHLKSLPGWYKTTTSPREIALHIKVLLRARREEVVVVSFTGAVSSNNNTNTNGQSTEDRVIIVCAKDRRQLLDAITRSLSARASIKEATIVTTGDGFALDRFVVQHSQPPSSVSGGGSPTEDGWEDALKHDIESLLASTTPNLNVKTIIPSPLVMVSPPRTESIHFQQVRLTRMLGEGRSGKTFVAQYNGSALVAAKVISASQHDTDALEQFQHELNLVSRLHHPNIVRFIGATSRPPRYMLLFELCEEGDLWSFLRGPQSPRRRFSHIQFMLDIALAINYLHGQGVLHRDLKPENLLLDKHLTIKVGDFGLSCYLTAKAEEFSPETGTYRYMAPEVLRHEPYAAPIDVYSFAMCCYVVLTRKAPFEHYSPLQTAMAVARQNARPKLTGLPKPLFELITQCWHPNPHIRPTFSEIVSRLGEIRQGLESKLAHRFDWH
ncbi:hypothetical protein BASA81_000910 [Batrachochytrium salamandrivorans]|nr:hypothetical protein BASA81_000910 [Batrachochytrium salamandrivorans]